MPTQTVASTFTALGNSASLFMNRGETQLNYTITGSFDATLEIQRKLTGDSGWATIYTLAAAESGTLIIDQQFQHTEYRIACTVYNSGTVTYSMSDGNEVLMALEAKDGTSVLTLDESGAIAFRVQNADRVTELGEAVVPAVKPYPVNLYDMKKSAALKDPLADTPGTSLLGLADTPGSVLTGTQTNGGSTASATESCAFEWALPAEYQAGEAITLRVRAKVTNLQQVADTVDAVVKAKTADGALGSDICATAAQDLTASYANYDFTITPTGLVAGDILNVVLTLATDDTGGTQDGTPTISRVEMRPTVLN